MTDRQAMKKLEHQKEASLKLAEKLVQALENMPPGSYIHRDVRGDKFVAANPKFDEGHAHASDTFLGALTNVGILK